MNVSEANNLREEYVVFAIGVALITAGVGLVGLLIYTAVKKDLSFDDLNLGFFLAACVIVGGAIIAYYG
jgi:hypothetical protein